MEQFDWVRGFIVPYFNFFLFLALAIYFFRGPLANLFAKRREDYLALLDEARQAKADAEAQNRELKAKLENLSLEMDSLRKTSIENAGKEAEAIGLAAQTLANNIREEAHRIADSEAKAAIEQLRHEMVDAAKKQVIERVQRELDEGAQQRILSQRIGKVDQLSSQLQGGAKT